MLFRLRVVPHRVRYLKNSMGPRFGSCKRRVAGMKHVWKHWLWDAVLWQLFFFFALCMEHLTWVFFPACVVFNFHLFEMWRRLSSNLSFQHLFHERFEFVWLDGSKFQMPKRNQIFLNLGMPQLKSDIMKQVSRALRAGCHWWCWTTN